MSRQEALQLVLVLLAASALVFALDAPHGPRELDPTSVTGGYVAAASAPLPPRAQPGARNVHHSSSGRTTC